jgi:two-component system, LuxR family, response regulator FixJ
LIVAGKANKCIAAELDIGVRTVESRRREVLQQMKAESVADLVRMVMEADLEARPIPLSQA